MAGQLWTWGFNFQGPLGDNTTVKKSSPVQTIAGGTDWKQVAGGYGHTAAIKTDGTLWTWGFNFQGQLGDNTTADKSSPVQTIAGGNNWSQVACGYYHTAAIKTDGTLWTWGFNWIGGLGDNTTADKSSPIQTIAGGTNWKQVAGGFYHTAAIKTDGTLWAWGRNVDGQLGDNTAVSKSSPVQTIAGGNNWSFVAGGSYHTAAIKTDGSLWTWGYNLFGALGDNTTVSKSSPVQTIAGGTNWSQVAGGIAYAHTAAIKTDGTLWTWGFNSNGQLGDNTTTNKSSPIQTTAGGTNWKQVAGGFFHTAAIKTDGTLWAWGWNSPNGQLGDNTIAKKSSPVQTIAGGTNWSQVAGGYAHTAAIYENAANQLGIKTQPLSAFNGTKLLVQPEININDSAGSVVRIASNTVTVSVFSGTATLSGTTTVTAVDGVATFTDLVLSGYGPVVLQFTSSGLTAASSTTFTVDLPSSVVPKRSENSGSIPTSGQLKLGELAINITDKKGYVKKSDGTIVTVFNNLKADGGVF